MKYDPQPPISPTNLLQNRVDVDYEYDNANDEGRIHRPLIGGSWVTHYERHIEVKKRTYERQQRRLQRDMIMLEIARRGFYIKEVERLDPENKTHRLCKIGISNQRRMNDEAQ